MECRFRDSHEQHHSLVDGPGRNAAGTEEANVLARCLRLFSSRSCRMPSPDTNRARGKSVAICGANVALWHMPGVHVADPISASKKRPTLPERPGWLRNSSDWPRADRPVSGGRRENIVLLRQRERDGMRTTFRQFFSPLPDDAEWSPSKLPPCLDAIETAQADLAANVGRGCITYFNRSLAWTKRRVRDRTSCCRTVDPASTPNDLAQRGAAVTI
jgi:hypothetical protein